jgi:Na+/H+ antiporter NhaD/arsenite permease-like protein
MAGITFFMSAVLDNMTTTIVMIMMLRKIIAKPEDRWIFSGIIIIAANSGGAWSPIGDVTTIMLWMRGNVTTIPLITYLILPCLVSLFIPLLITSFKFRKSHGNYLSHQPLELRLPQGVGKRFSRGIFVVGVLGLLSVPVFKTVTGLPPYVGVMFVLGGLWVLTEVIYGRKRDLEESIKNRVSKVLKHIDMPTILFFLGILMSVAGLQSAGILGTAADFLDKNIHEVFTISTTVGVLSSVVDNVPLVAACMGMYPVALPDVIAASADPVYMQAFAQDGLFWILLTYCAGVGGSILIIGSAAGVIAMGLEKIDFWWYLKNVSVLAFLGYIAGVVIIYLESLFLI